MNDKFIDHEKTTYELADLKTYFGLANGKTMDPTPPSGDLHSLFRQQAIEIEALKKLVFELHAAIMNQPKDEWITTPEALKIVPVCERTLQKYRDNQMIPFKKTKGKIFYKKQDVIDFMDGSI